MKNQVLFSSRDKSKKLKCRLLQFLFGALRIKEDFLCFTQETAKKEGRSRKSDKSSPPPFHKTAETLKKLIKEEKHDTRLVFAVVFVRAGQFWLSHKEYFM